MKLRKEMQSNFHSMKWILSFYYSNLFLPISEKDSRLSNQIAPLLSHHDLAFLFLHCFRHLFLSTDPFSFIILKKKIFFYCCSITVVLIFPTLFSPALTTPLPSGHCQFVLYFHVWFCFAHLFVLLIRFHL